MTKQSEQTEHIVVFEYPLRQRMPALLLLAMVLVVNLVMIFVVVVSAVRIITGYEFASGVGSEEPGALIAGIVIPAFLTLLSFVINFLFPAVHVTSSGFRISRLFYTSPWLDWQDIRDIKSHWLSNRLRDITAITVDNISAVYRFIGIFELLDGKGFMIVDRINDYPELMQVLREHRPDLFE